MMNTTLKLLINVLILILSCYSIAQEYAGEIPDSLLQKEYDELEDLYYDERDLNNEEGAQLYAKAYLIKAKSEKDSINIARAFKYIAYAGNDTLAYRYADSIIHYTENSNNKYYPARGYIIKGGCLYDWGEYDKSLDNLLIAYTYAQQQQSTNQLMEIRYVIGAIKNSWGAYDEALAIFKENLIAIQQQENYRTKYKEDYLIALHSLYACYMRKDDIDSAKIYIKKGIAETLALGDSTRYYRFVLGSGIADYFNKNYRVAIDSINKAIPNTNEYTLMMGYLYKGKSLYNLKQQDSGIVYLKKTDSIYNDIQDEFPELREMYQTFVDYYKEKGDIENQLLYINKLLSVDSLMMHNYKYLNKNIVQKYDTPFIMAQKEALITKLHQDKSTLSRNIIVITAISLMLIVAIIIYYNKRRKVYKKRFELFLKEQEQNKEAAVKTTTENREKIIKHSGLSEEIAQEIIEKLTHFEAGHDYIDNKITLHSLAKQLETNSAYLSKAVNAYKSKNFAAYINELRVDYAIEKLKTDATFRRYVVKTIAYEVGFNSSESFSRTFYKKTGVYPSYFIKQLEKQEESILI